MASVLAHPGLGGFRAGRRKTDALAWPGTHRRQARGFTLLEVLVVVAIMALLIAVLLPGLREAREQSRRVACQSNLHQLGLAWHQYLDAHAGRFLQGTNANTNYGGRQGASAAYRVPKPLNRFIKLDRITQVAALFACPSDRGTKAAKPKCYTFYGTSYNTNLMLIGQNKLYVDTNDPCAAVMNKISPRIAKLTRDSVTTNPSKLVLLGDYAWVNQLTFNSTLTGEWHGAPTGYNLNFFDGHSEFVRIRKGLHVTSRYTDIPFEDLLPEAAAQQKEVLP